jgi:BMFP domain-containing protein YqiC
MGPKEEEDLVSRSANQAVEAMGTVLAAAREERERMAERIGQLEARDRRHREEAREQQECIRELIAERADLRRQLGIA